MSEAGVQIDEVRRIVREEIEAALDRRRQASRPVVVRPEIPWDRVRAEIEARLSNVRAKDSERYRMLIAVTTVIRSNLGLSHIRFLTPEQEPEALKIAHAVLDLMKVPRASVEAAGADPGAAEAEE